MSLHFDTRICIGGFVGARSESGEHIAVAAEHHAVIA